MKKIVPTLLSIVLGLVFAVNTNVHAQEKASEASNSNTEATENFPKLPVGTIIFLKATKDIYGKNFKAGDHFFVELDRDITSKGTVLIPKGTLVQMEVLVSEHNKRRGSKFAITVGGFIVDNFVQKCKTEGKLIETEGTMRGTLKKAAIGAAVGGAFDGGDGAGKGAVVGGAVGALNPGTIIKIPKGTEGTFQLSEELSVDWLNNSK